MKTNHRGFTLVELIVTLVVAMLLITVGVPSLTSLYEGIRARSAIDTIESGLLLARSQAVSYGSSVSVCPMSGTTCGGSWKNGFSVFIDNGVAGTIDTTAGITDTVITVTNSFNDSDFITSDFNIITFSPDGLAQSVGNSRILYCPGSKTNEDSLGIDISQSGKIQRVTTSVNCN